MAGLAVHMKAVGRSLGAAQAAARLVLHQRASGRAGARTWTSRASAAPSTQGELQGTFHRLAIVGGGLGGLVAARVLQRHGRDVVVFEREPSRDARSQGGLLDLHVESGQWALHEAGLFSEFLELAHPEGQDTRIIDKTGAVLWDEISPPGVMDRPEVQRTELRSLLLDSLEPGTVQWDHQLVSAQWSGDGRHVLQFANGASVGAGLVIGADGARSSLRPLLTPARPSYTGVSFVEISVSDPDRRHPELSRLVGRGSMFALGDDKGMMTHRHTSSIHIYVALRMPEGGFEQLGITFGDPAATRAALAAQFAGWAPELVRLIDACDDSFLPRPLHAMPIGASWPSQPGITLLGDAAHLMSPFAGAGANMAMQDGVDLALELLKAGDGDLAPAVAAYEARMFERAAAEAQQSAEGLEMCISPQGAHALAQFMQSFQQPDAPDA